MAKEVLSLQEKMVGIRSRIPALVKRAYSEEVNYDFTKIDDIFRYLTPAMNEYKVNWEIESEKATIQDASGNPLFIRYLEGPMVWLYEADLTIRWINAEMPDDTISVTVHAIGTHEMPEKAKGSGWTYALKYYLLDKYCIDQGGEDPDMRAGMHPEEDSYQEAASGEYTEDACGEEYEDSGEDMAEGTAGSGEYDEQAFTEELPDEPPVEHAAAESSTESEAGWETVSEQETPFSNTQKEHSDTKRARTACRTQGKTREQNPPVSEYIRPQNGKMVELPESVKQEAASQLPGNQPENAEMSLEEAYSIICTFGTQKGLRLGEMAQKGEDGSADLKWLAYEYRGKNAKLREGARMILKAAQAA